MKKHLMILAALLASTPAKANDTVSDNGNEILEICDRGTNFGDGFCIGYIRGLKTAVDVIIRLNDRQTCYPDGITVGQLRDVVVSYVRRNPANRHEGATLVFMRAISEAWPCK